MRRLFAALAAVLVVGGFVAGTPPAAAEQTIPTQEGWDAARQHVTLPSGLDMAYVQLSDGEGVPLILLHGYTDNSRSWSLVAPYLGTRPIYALDLRGHGASEVVACCYGLDSLASDVIGFMDAMGIEKADLVGHSLGSMTAGVVAGLAPERVNRLVLISSTVEVPAGTSGWLWDNVPGLVHPIDPESQFMQDWYWNPNPVDEVFLRYEMRESAARPQEVWMGVLKAMSLTDWSFYAHRIAAPTLVLWGDQDAMFGAPEQEALRAAIPAARFETFAGHGHNLFWEVPEEAGGMIAGFLAE